MASLPSFIPIKNLHTSNLNSLLARQPNVPTHRTQISFATKPESKIKKIFPARGVDLTLRDLLVLAKSRHQAKLSNKNRSRNVYQQLLLLLLV
jgi:hypothetical protein